MNRKETIDWIVSHGEAFPDFAAWVSSIVSEKRSKLLDAWAVALSDVDLRDATAVTARMVSGDDPPIAAYERELTAAKVRTLAKANSDRRAERDRETTARQRQDKPPPRHTDGFSAGALYRKLLTLIDANPGMDARQAAEQVVPPTDERDGPRYDCHQCQDTGIVMVWSELSTRAALVGDLDNRSKRRSCAAPCTCQRGQAKIWTRGEPPRSWRSWQNVNATYSPTNHCVCLGGDTDSDQAVNAFRQWVVAAKDRHDNRNREPAFDAFNRGENF